VGKPVAHPTFCVSDCPMARRWLADIADYFHQQARLVIKHLATSRCRSI
jgi:hypothetical protein